MSENENENDAPVEMNERHREKMKKRKAARDKMMASKTEERGLIIVHTGKAKANLPPLLA